MGRKDEQHDALLEAKEHGKNQIPNGLWSYVLCTYLKNAGCLRLRCCKDSSKVKIMCKYYVTVGSSPCHNFTIRGIRCTHVRPMNSLMASFFQYRNPLG